MAPRPTSQTRQNQQQSSSNTQQVNPNQNQVNSQTAEARSTITDTARTFRTDGNKTGVNKLRAQIGKEMDQEFVECEFEDFMEAYLPFVPDDDVVDACLARLRKANTREGDPILRQINLGTDERPNLCECLADFHDPIHTTEAQLFSRLDDIADVIAESMVDERKYRYQFYDCHSRDILSDIEGSTNQIDACFPPVGIDLPESGEREDAADRLHTSLIPVACEWKLRKTPDNKKEVVSANVQIMNADASRMFSFGMTIEEDELRLWYFSRSHSAVSIAVDYVKNPAFLVQAFMSFMFATREEMGYDPTVAFHDNNNYTYSIPSAKPRGETRFFRTRHIISEYRSNNVTGRMVRVWLVDEVTSFAKNAKAVIGKPQYVLKDVWLEESAQTESQIQEAIFTSIDAFLSSPSSEAKEAMEGMWRNHRQLVENGAYKDFFLNIETDYEGQRSKPLVKDHTKWRGLFVVQNIFATTPPETNTASRQPTRSTCGTPRGIHVPSEVQPQQHPREYARKKQYRLIFKEHCVPVVEMKQLADVIQVLQQTLILHRDISSGNILAYKQEDGSWKAKVSDLEYAKKFPPDSKSTSPAADPKTGTPYFMAHEILEGHYIHRPPRPHLIGTASDFKRVSREERDPVIRNFQHDLEALYWLILWTLVDRIPYEPSHKYSKEIFSNTVAPSTLRSKAFMDPIVAKLEMTLKPSVAFLAIPLEVIRNALHAVYEQREKANQVDNPRAYVDIYNSFSLFFQAIAEERSAWVDEELFSRREVAKQLNINNETSESNDAGTQLSAPRRAKRIRGSQSLVHSRGSNTLGSLTSSAQVEDSTAEFQGSRSTKRARTGK
ncbi:hypothetical protein CPC08DRAFT_723418 [Agrocybe pediades]|nr:hypothetical protein CPC08DRAFT_723418 [Agrocybe pediades]